MRRRVAMIIAVALAALGALAIRVVFEGKAALADGDRRARAGDTRGAVIDYEAAARWYLPLAPHVAGAYAKLHGLTGGDPQLALSAWRAIRGAARATRSHADEAAAADAEIAELEAGVEDRGSGDLAVYQAGLAADDRAGLGSALLAALGLAAWLGGVAMLLWRGLDDTGRLVTRPALRAGAAIVVGIAAWLVGIFVV